MNMLLISLFWSEIYLLALLIIGIPSWFLFNDFSFIQSMWKNWKYSPKNIERRICSFFKEEGIFFKRKDGELYFQYRDLWYGINIENNKELKACVVHLYIPNEEVASLESVAKYYLSYYLNGRYYLSKAYIYDDGYRIATLWDLLGTTPKNSFPMLIERIMRIANELEEKVKFILEQGKEEASSEIEEEVVPVGNA